MVDWIKGPRRRYAILSAVLVRSSIVVTVDEKRSTLSVTFSRSRVMSTSGSVAVSVE